MKLIWYVSRSEVYLRELFGFSKVLIYLNSKESFLGFWKWYFVVKERKRINFRVIIVISR